MGLNFLDPKGQYDASAYKGISFWGKKAAGTGNIRLKVPDKNTDPDGKVCSECFNDFGADITLGDNWEQYFFPFSRMKQMKGWGNPRVSSVDPTTLYGIQFQANEKNTPFDVWIDDVQFTGCQ
jgi:endoglucanase